MNSEEINNLCEQYKREVLYGDGVAATKLRDTLQEQLNDPESFFNEVKTWLAKCMGLREEVLALAGKGKTRDSMEFDDIQPRAEELGQLALEFLTSQYNYAIREYHNRICQPANVQKKCLLSEITKFASWGTGGQSRLNDTKSEFVRLFPNDAHEMEQAVSQGIKNGELYKSYSDKAYKLGSTGQARDTLESLVDEARKEGIYYAEAKIRKQYDSGCTARKRKRESGQKEIKFSTASHETYSSFNISTGDMIPMQPTKTYLDGIHPNSLTQIPPAAKWTVLIDETGSEFTERTFEPGLKKYEYGRVVALFVPEYTILPDLPLKWHACQSPSVQEIADVANTIWVNSCGVLGISLASLNKIRGDQWLSCIEALLDLAWRLIQIDGETQIELVVEQRGNMTSKMSELLQKTCDTSLYHLSRAFPEKAKNIRVVAKFIAKEQHPWNGYVDAVAFVWGGSTAATILKESQWVNTCLLAGPAHSLRQCLDLMEREEYLTAEQWSELVASDEAGTPNSLVSALLRNLGQQVRNDTKLWFDYVNSTCLHLNSKAINLYRLGRQINWLKAWIPDDAKFPPKMRLLWLTTKLAEENHHGKIVRYQKQRDEFVSLSEQLFREDAPLTCNAALHLAVSYMNEFDFDGAEAVLTPWQLQPHQVPGLQYYGQLLSSFGQIKAFLGDNARARKYFDDAIATFNELSDAHSAQLDILQTSAYLLTALMDLGETYKDELEVQLSKYFGASTEEAAERLCGSDNPGEKYAHHLLLRYLHSGLASKNVAQRYLANRSQWKTGTGHPWELIEFYRALLFDDVKERLPLLRNAYHLATAEDEGMTIRLIAAVILGSIWLDDPSVDDEYRKLVECVTSAIPALGARGDLLREQTQRRRSPLELARAVLPFNFR